MMHGSMNILLLLLLYSSQPPDNKSVLLFVLKQLIARLNHLQCASHVSYRVYCIVFELLSYRKSCSVCEQP